MTIANPELVPEHLLLRAILNVLEGKPAWPADPVSAWDSLMRLRARHFPTLDITPGRDQRLVYDDLVVLLGGEPVDHLPYVTGSYILGRALTAAEEPPTPTPPAILTDLVAYWPTASAGAVDLTDYVNGLNLTNNGVVTRGDGPNVGIPDAAVFNGTTQFLSVADNPLLEPGAAPLCLAYWMRPANVTATVRLVAGKYLTTGNQRAYGSLQQGTSAFWNVSADGIAASNAADVGLAATTYAYVVALWTGAELRTRIDLSAPGAVNAFAGPVFNGSAPFTIGAGAAAALPYPGRVTEVALWIGRVPPDDELIQHRDGFLRQHFL